MGLEVEGGPGEKADTASEDSSGEEVETGDSGSEEGEGEEEGQKFVSSRRPRNEDKDSKKLRKSAIKEDKAEKRKDKIKKHVKKRKEASGRRAIKK